MGGYNGSVNFRLGTSQEDHCAHRKTKVDWGGSSLCLSSYREEGEENVEGGGGGGGGGGLHR